MVVAKSQHILVSFFLTKIQGMREHATNGEERTTTGTQVCHNNEQCFRLASAIGRYKPKMADCERTDLPEWPIKVLKPGPNGRSFFRYSGHGKSLYVLTTGSGAVNSPNIWGQSRFFTPWPDYFSPYFCRFPGSARYRFVSVYYMGILISSCDQLITFSINTCSNR